MTTTDPTDAPTDAPARRRRRRPRRLWALVMLLALAVVAVAVVQLVRSSALLDGPVGNEGVYSSGGSVPFGELAATGSPTAFNSGDKTAVLERIELVDPPPGIEVVETHIAGRDRGAIPAMRKWPDPDFQRDLHPVDGFRLAPESTDAGRYGVSLVFVMNIKKPGRHAVKAVDVHYRIGGTRYKARIRNGFAVCSYTGKRVVSCPSPRDL